MRSGYDPLYGLWLSMRKRCRDPKASGYRYYGGRGIGVCARWDSFALFKVDMGPRPEGTTLDRIDVNGNYTPDNCRWASKAEQVRNSGAARILELDGESMCIAAWSERIGVKANTIAQRLHCGWSVRRALGGMP